MAGFAWMHTNLAPLLDVSFDPLDLVQWPAMVVTIVASYLVASQNKRRRNWGFWIFLLSNVLWVIWGWHAKAYALIVLQAGLAFMNIRGVKKNDTHETTRDS
jgi:hypothetical protein